MSMRRRPLRAPILVRRPLYWWKKESEGIPMVTAANRRLPLPLIRSLTRHELADAELLHQYDGVRDEAAFAELVRRNGPLVLRTCRHVLGDTTAAEDAFQATFVLLARKARQLPRTGSLAGWLHTVALRTARDVRRADSRRRLREQACPAPPPPPAPANDIMWREVRERLDAELAALPETYRVPLALCYLQELTYEEAARQAGCSVGALRGRLERGKELLRKRLARYGLPLAAPILVLGRPPAVSAALREATLAAARALFMGGALPPAAALVGVGSSGRLKAVLLSLAFAGVVAVGLALHGMPPAEGDAPANEHKEQPVPGQGVVNGVERTDALGDPLPPGALGRLGSVRLRHNFVGSAAFSPDGKLLASGGWDQAICLWDPATGRELRQIRGVEEGVNAVAFSPDGKLLVGAGMTKVVYLWDVASGKQVARLEGHEGSVRAVAFSAQGDKLVSGDDKAVVRLWDVAGAKALRSLEVKEAVYAVTFSPDGKTVAAAGLDKTARVWKTEGGELVHHLQAHAGPIESIAFSRDGQFLVTAGWDQTLVWDATSGKKLERLTDEKGGGSRAAFSPDGKLLAVASHDQVIRLWDWAARKRVLQLPRHAFRVRSLAFSPDARALATVSDGTAIHLWDLATGKQQAVQPGHQERLTSASYSADGHTIVTASWDGTVRLWDARKGTELRRFGVGRPGRPHDTSEPAPLSQVVLSADGKLVAAARGDEVVHVWDAASGKEVRRFQAGCVAFSPDGELIACGGRGTTADDVNRGVIRLYERNTGKPVRELRGHLTPVAGLTFTPDGRSLISRGAVLLGVFARGFPGGTADEETRFFRLWDVATGKERRSFSGGQSGEAVPVSPDGRTLVETGSRVKSITLWETATGEKRAELVGHTEGVNSVSIAPDGRTLASGSMDGTIRLWDLPGGKELGRLEGHRGWVLSVAFAPDGQTLVSGGADTTALVWDVRRFTRRVAQPAKRSAEELESSWSALERDAATAYRAMDTLLLSPAATLAFLGERLKPVADPEPRLIARLVEDLNSDRFDTREQATRELEQLGEGALPALQSVLARNPSPEVKRRLEMLRETVENRTSMRQARAVEILEGLGSPEARRLLATLATGAGHARQTREAKAALARLK
jgi:RNA polymerase sigma factor (sigma-70 family)